MGDWIRLSSRRRIDPLDLHIDDLDLRDIAIALDANPRFGGHTHRRWISLAHHSLMVSARCAPAHKAWGLMHDAAEAYLHDFPRPIKSRAYYRANGELQTVAEVERSVLRLIAERWSLGWPPPPEVKEVDSRILLTEALYLYGESEIREWPLWEQGVRPYDDVRKIPRRGPGRLVNTFRLAAGMLGIR